jgi:hypothetical protein
VQGTTVPLDGCAPRSAALITCRLSPGLLPEWPVAVLTYMLQPFDFTGFLLRESPPDFAALNPSYDYDMREQTGIEFPENRENNREFFKILTVYRSVSFQRRSSETTI